MITSNAIHRTFRIRFGSSVGTCFTIDVDGRQYLITAKHVLPNVPATGAVQVHHQRDWRNLNYELTGVGSGEVDIAVLSPETQLSPALSLPPVSEGIIFGQSVFFLGFPYGIATELGPINRDFPLPLVKGGLLSAIMRGDNGEQLLLVDGHNNPGFSGGPLLFAKPGSNDLNVAGVISAYRFNREPVYAGDTPTALTYLYNTGIIIVYAIEQATELIRQNPNGLLLAEGLHV